MGNASSVWEMTSGGVSSMPITKQPTTTWNHATAAVSVAHVLFCSRLEQLAILLGVHFVAWMLPASFKQPLRNNTTICRKSHPGQIRLQMPATFRFLYWNLFDQGR